MKKSLCRLCLAVLLGCFCSVNAHAMENDMLKVGIKYGSEAMFSANLQNYNDAVAGKGYAAGYFDTGRSFVPLGPVTDEYKVSVTVDGNFYASGNAYYEGAGGVGGWHLQIAQTYDGYEAAADVASRYDDAFVAYLTNAYAVRVGQYASLADAEAARAAWDGDDSVETVSPSKTGVVVTATGTNRVLFYFDCGGLRSLALMPQSVDGEKPVTWFRGYRYYGGFEYQRVTGGNINVINVVNIEDYVKGSVGWEIGSNKPLEAIKAQAVCARTYAAMQTRHRAQGFDVCTTDDCQVYQGVASASEVSNRAVDETAGVYMYYNGKYIEAYYYSSNGGASEDASNVWAEEVPYCKGKPDPYEAYVASRISGYRWEMTYTKSELTERLKSRGINIGTVENVYVSQFTPNGNVYAVTFSGTAGTKTVYREMCRLTLGARSMRFTIAGGAGGAATGPGSYYVNAGNTLSALRDMFVIAGGGTLTRYAGGEGEAYVATSDGVSLLKKTEATTPTASSSPSDRFTITGTGWGHNVGMSQWGAVSMAEQGYDYRDILNFYYTGIVIE